MNKTAGLFFCSVVFFASIVHCAGEQVAPAQTDNQITAVQAPPLGHINLSEQKAIGIFDAIAPTPHSVALLVINNDTLELVEVGKEVKQRKIKTGTRFKNAAIVAVVNENSFFYAFFEQPGAFPFIYDIAKDAFITFQPEKVKLKDGVTIGVQSAVFSVNKESAIVMVTSGDQETWPREGSRPLYFWASLSTGAAKQVPLGWDLAYFSKDMALAAFEIPQEKQFERRPQKAIAFSDGKIVDSFADYESDFWLPFDWGNSDEARPLFNKRRRSQFGDRDEMVGISSGGKAYRFAFSVWDPLFPCSIRICRDWAAYRVRGSSDGGYQENWPLWVARLNADERPLLIGEEVKEFELMANDFVVLTRPGKTGKIKNSIAALAIDLARNATWDILDGIDFLPELGTSLAEKPSVVDSLNVALHPAYGTSPCLEYVLARCTHQRGDFRAVALPFEEPSGTVETRQLTKDIIVTSGGGRFLVSGLPSDKYFDFIFPFASGVLVAGTYTWENGTKKTEAWMWSFDGEAVDGKR